MPHGRWAVFGGVRRARERGSEPSSGRGLVHSAIGCGNTAYTSPLVERYTERFFFSWHPAFELGHCPTLPSSSPRCSSNSNPLSPSALSATSVIPVTRAEGMSVRSKIYSTIFCQFLLDILTRSTPHCACNQLAVSHSPGDVGGKIHLCLERNCRSTGHWDGCNTELHRG